MSFQENERVLAFNGPLLYEAKILQIDEKPQFKMDPEKKGPYYLVHYKGWKSSFDEWLRHPRVLKLDERGLQRQKQLATSHKAKLKRDQAEGKNANRKTTKPDNNAGRKRGRESTIDQDDEWRVRPEMKLSFPDAAKVLLVDDWEAVTKQHKLVPLPREPSVEAILDAYEQEATTKFKPPRPLSMIQELRQGLLFYFNRTIDKNLLYPIERAQLEEWQAKDPERDLASVYGAEHLLRLFVNLPELIAQSTMDPEGVAYLRETLQDVLKWLVANQKTCFLDPLTEYQDAPQTAIDALEV